MLYNKLAPARLRGRVSEAALDVLPVPVVIVAHSRKVLLVNRPQHARWTPPER
jgi:hypothetical protein